MQPLTIITGAFYEAMITRMFNYTSVFGQSVPAVWVLIQFLLPSPYILLFQKLGLLASERQKNWFIKTLIHININYWCEHKKIYLSGLWLFLYCPVCGETQLQKSVLNSVFDKIWYSITKREEKETLPCYCYIQQSPQAKEMLELPEKFLLLFSQHISLCKKRNAGASFALLLHVPPFNSFSMDKLHYENSRGGGDPTHILLESTQTYFSNKRESHKCNIV